MKKLTIFLFLFFATVIAYSQQEAQFSHNMFNIMAINPAYAGSNNAICATLLVRQQWVGFKDAEGNKTWPQTNLLSVDGAVAPLHGGLGMTIIQDQLGFEKNLGVKLAYAYKRAIKTATFSAGLEVCFLNKKIDFTKFVFGVPGDPLIGGKEGNMATDLAFGLFYKIPNKMYLGLSGSQLLTSKIHFATSDALPQLARHAYLTGGYYLPVPGSASLELDPSFLLKTDLVSMQVDINCLVKYNNQFWGGVSYRTADAFVALIGMNWKSFHFGYSYDITTSPLGASGRSSGSHEIMIGYCFKIISVPRIESYKNPRFL